MRLDRGNGYVDTSIVVGFVTNTSRIEILEC